ncbi:MAG TPA: peptidase M16 [Cytophagales bacterium]|jgi:zinc protease|nr:peptidase M16 [Cytophagales bacterium]
MIHFHSFTLPNGLQVFVHEDHDTPMAVMNILYNVGSKDEDENKTGFAHLFEHLMFGGSANIPSYDEPLQAVGGENNAFTSPDITNYYLSLPSQSLETAFWLESDRMLSLSFDPKVLEVQRKVVIEEFKQRYLNQPYGDVWLKLNPLAYQKHSYRWNTIGKEIKHIEQATMEDVKQFFYKFYIPNNALMVVAGNVTVAEVQRLSEKWFGPIPSGKPYHRNIPQEPIQTAQRRLEVKAKVPVDALYMAFHMCDRMSPDYHATDLLSDIVGRGASSRLHHGLVKERPLFSSISAHVSGSVDPGLFVVNGRLNKGVKLEEAEKAVWEILDKVVQEQVDEKELLKVKNQAESSLVFSEVELLNRAMNLAFGANLGDADYINKESELISSVTTSQLRSVAEKVLIPQNSSILHYIAE